ncbi:DoxX family protein [Flavicella sediminum]|uniref:DoxX family protein n=1 Tax=Flavicella sediminum TaxID=2585141 RepID=UPI00111FDD18|nr:DoxX family protein [Flavicella sediminum]
MRILVFIIRILVSATFLYSGFVKLVDPTGSAYKFQEYFGADVLNMEFLIPYALPFSILLILTEIMLGVTLLIGYKRRITVWALFGITLLFLFLTWYSAYYNKVTDCGCFGDALKLSTWETFYKNVVLIVFILFLLVKKGAIYAIFSDKILRNITIAFFVGFSYVVYHVLVHLPIIDFRAYAIGKNIQEGMEFVDGSDELPPVHDFFLESDVDGDLTDKILSAEKAMLVIAFDINESDQQGFAALQEVAQKAKEKGYLVYGVSASSTSDLVQLQKDQNLPFEFLFCDETTLKTIIRANPGIVTLNKGTVVGKWNWIDADEVFARE